jgi:chitin disaccharide deacetylase
VTRVLIVNADDFGRSHGINRGVALAHDQGIVTSASAMVHWPAAEDAADLARGRPALGVGLHVDLEEWAYADGDWHVVYKRAAGDETAVAEEVEAQLTRFRMLFGREPTHLDSHQHVHREEPMRSVLLEAGRRLGVTVRDCSPGIAYRGDFYGQTAKGEPLPDGIALESLLQVLSSLPPGITELGCHPASEAETGSSYAAERVQELRVLCDPRVQAAVRAERIELLSFAGLREGRP